MVNTTAAMVGEEMRRIRRERLGLTQAKLAERMGVTKTTVARWETGQRRISELAARFLRLLAGVATPEPKGRRR